jgi:PGF-CTERM protein
MRPNVSTGLVTAAVVLALVASSTAAVADVGGEWRSAAVGQAGGTPDIQVTPVTLRFSNDTYGATGATDATTRTLAVRNVGNATLTVRSIVVVGPDRASFEPAFDGPVTLDPGERREVVVSFEPPESGSEPRFATMHVMSDDPDEPQTNVWLTNTDTVADVSPSRVLETRTLVNATVTDVEANVTQSVNLSWPLTRDDVVAVDALSFTLARDGDVALTVATNESRFGDVPGFAPADGTEPAAFVRVAHDVSNEDVANVTFTLRVRKARLAGNETGPEDVAFYRREAGTWVELPTRFVEEGDTHYFFEADAPGLSDFVTGVKQATFRITDAVVTVTRIRTDEGTDVLVRVRNVGGADGTYAVRLLLADAVVDRRELSIAPNGTRQATFERSFDEPGTYEVFVNDRFVANVTVAEPGTATDGTGADGSATPTGDGGASSGTGGSSLGGSVPGFGPATALLALLVAALLLARPVRRRGR